MDWMKLKSGSDVRGVAVGENAPLTEHVAMCLGMAFARYVAKHVGKPVTQVTIAIGRDSRISGPALLHAAAEGVSKAGASVLDFGMCTTPAMYMCIITPGFQPDGSIMITASHHPYDKNGLKFFLAEGGVEGDVVEELLKTASTLEPEDTPLAGTIVKKPFLPTYKEQLADRIRLGLGTDVPKPLLGLHVVVDAGNGATVEKDAKIATIYPNNAMQIKMVISEADLMDVTVGGKAEIEFNWDADSGRRFEGTISSISYLSEKKDDSAASQSAQYVAYVDFTPDETVSIGMTVIVYVE